MTELHFVVPSGIRDPLHPSGGNVYDRRVAAGLAALGWPIREQAASDAGSVASALAGVPDGALVLIDGLIARAVPLAEAERLRLVVLLHMPRDDPREAAALAAAAAVVATSGWTRAWLAERYGLESARVVPPGVDAAELAPGTGSGGRLLCVGAVTQVKGQDLLIDALGRVHDLRWRCDCVGALDVEPAFASQVRRRSGDRVRFTGPLADVGAAYAEADVLIVASRAETYGMVVTEALARGLPVIATGVGGVPEALGRAEDGSLPGLLVPAGDPQALGGALRRWLGDASERARLRGAARSRRLTLVGWSQTARSLSRVLTEVSG